MTRECIDSIFTKTKGINFEIILVDNASTDGSENYFKGDKRILFIQSNKNLGFGRANNLGAKYSKGKYLFLLNSDTIISLTLVPTVTTQVASTFGPSKELALIVTTPGLFAVILPA